MAKISTLEKKEDQRGWLVEIFKEEISPGQVYLFTSRPSVIRGNHWHDRKTEWFCCLVGKVKLTLEDKSTGRKEEIILDADKEIQKVFIPAGVIHTVENIGEVESFVVAYISEKFDPEDPDTFYLS